MSHQKNCVLYIIFDKFNVDSTYIMAVQLLQFVIVMLFSINLTSSLDINLTIEDGNETVLESGGIVLFLTTI